MQENFLNQAREWMNSGMDKEQTAQQLLAAGLNPEEVKEIISTVRKERHKRNFARGMSFLCVGLILCFVSMLSTLIFGHSYWVLYGVTMVGATLIFVVMMYCMMG